MLFTTGGVCVCIYFYFLKSLTISNFVLIPSETWLTAHLGSAQSLDETAAMMMAGWGVNSVCKAGYLLFSIILNNPPVLCFDLFSLAGLPHSEEMSQVAVETTSLYLIRWIIKIKHKHGYRVYLASMFITKFLVDVMGWGGGKPQWQTSYKPPKPLGGGLALCW